MFQYVLVSGVLKGVDHLAGSYPWTGVGSSRSGYSKWSTGSSILESVGPMVRVASMMEIYYGSVQLPFRPHLRVPLVHKEHRLLPHCAAGQILIKSWPTSHVGLSLS